ncbi:VOC family protein [Actinomycetospora atypica]|uniref:VOC family protein n=1 Tax=Actinomycetospora atypica TaxID=1290095 RepID=A0ABV9YJE6_9PSEU
MLRLGFPVLGVADLDRAATFWSTALDLRDSARWASDTWRTLVTEAGEEALGLMRSGSPVEPRPRVHVDLFVDSVEEQQTEVRRLLELGAADPGWTDYPENPDFVVLADPDGNLFCVVDLSHAPSS